MSNIRGLHDDKDSHPDEDPEDTTSFAGGHRSGLAVINPGDTKPKIRIRIYTDGFIIDGSNFRSISDPRNAEFLRGLRSGETPPELEERVRSAGGAINVELSDIDRKYDADLDANTITESSVGPRDTHAVFHGVGCSLASSSVSRQDPVVPTNLGYPSIDDSKPKTTIQIRFPSGTRCVRTFNSGDTAKSLIELVASASGVLTEDIVLSAGFPPRPIPHSELNSKSLSDIGLCNSAVSVSFK